MSLPLTKIQDAPLLDREQDQSDLQQLGVQNNLKNLNFTLDALRAINCRRPLGNEREMQNRVKRTVIMTESKKATIGLLSQSAPSATLKETGEKIEKELGH
jgi:DNA-binding NtrC family response regulator